MKRSILLIVVALVATMTFGQNQSISIEASQLFSTFHFVNSSDTKESADYQSIPTSAYGIAYRHILDNNVILKGGLAKRNSGANYVYDGINNSWQLEYTDVKVGGGYLFDLGRFNPYAMLSAYYGFLLNGTQTLNNEVYNIKESEILQKNDMGIIGHLGVNLQLSDYVSAFAEAQYLCGFKNIEKQSSQKANNRSYGIALGLSFNISK